MNYCLAIGALLLPTVSAQEAQPAERGLKANLAGALPGYTLYSPLRETKTYLVDMQGEVVHSWKHERGPGNTAYLQPDGSLLRATKVASPPVFHGGGQGGRIERIAWNGEVTWSYTVADEAALHHHDFEVLPNGNLLLIAWEQKTREEAIAMGRDPESMEGDIGIWPDWILEVRPSEEGGGEVVWEWHAWDHLIQDFDPEKPGYGDVTAHPEKIDVNAGYRDQPPLSLAERERREEVEREMRALGYVGDEEDEEANDGAEPRGRDGRGPRKGSGDWLHTNGIDHDPTRDLIVLSVRSLSEVWVIDHSTTTEEAATSSGGNYGRGGDLLWRWGNPQNYGAGKGRDRRLFVQHDARFIPEGMPGAGNITIYNNGEGRPDGRHSSVEEVSIVLDDDRRPVRGERGMLLPAEALWSYGHGEGQHFFSSFISGAERLANGNTLITSGAEARIFEVTPSGEVVWDYLVPFSKDGEGKTREGRPAPPGEGRRRGAAPGERPDRRGRPDRGAGGQRDGAGGGRGPGGGMIPSAVHRSSRIPLDHPGLSGLDPSED